MHYIRSLLLLLTALLLSACSPWQDLPLLHIDTATLGPAKVVQQRLAITWDKETHVLENMMEIDAEGLRVVGLAMGVRVYSFDYDGQQLQAGPGHLPRSLSEQRIANDLLLIYAPLSALTKALPEDWHIEEQTLDNGMRLRKLLQNKEEVARIQYDAGAPWQGRCTLTQQRGDYQLILDSASEP